MYFRSFIFAAMVSFCTVPLVAIAEPDWNPLLDTGQTRCSDAGGNVIPCPAEESPFHGQDAQYSGPALRYYDNSDGTVTDYNTGLIWQQIDIAVDRLPTSVVDVYDAMEAWWTWAEAVQYCDNLELGKNNDDEYYDDWRLPERIELKSIVNYGSVPPAHNSVFEWSMELTWQTTGLVDENGFSYDKDRWMREWSFWWTATRLNQGNYNYYWSVSLYDGRDYWVDLDAVILDTENNEVLDDAGIPRPYRLNTRCVRN